MLRKGCCLPKTRVLKLRHTSDPKAFFKNILCTAARTSSSNRLCVHHKSQWLFTARRLGREINRLLSITDQVSTHISKISWITLLSIQVGYLFYIPNWVSIHLNHGVPTEVLNRCLNYNQASHSIWWYGNLWWAKNCGRTGAVNFPRKKQNMNHQLKGEERVSLKYLNVLDLGIWVCMPAVRLVLTNLKDCTKSRFLKYIISNQKGQVGFTLRSAVAISLS